jgi:hypothetical protein
MHKPKYIILLLCLLLAGCESEYSGSSYRRSSSRYGRDVYYPSLAHPDYNNVDLAPALTRADEPSEQPRQPTLEERQQEARQWLIAFMATRFIAHHSEPTDFGEALVRELAKWGSEWGIDNSLATLFPEASETERAAIRGVLIALTELKLSPDQISQQVTKEVFMAKLEQSDPNLAAGATIAEKAWSLTCESFKAADRGSKEHGQ